MMWVIPKVFSLENSNLFPLHSLLPVSKGVKPEMVSGPTLASTLFPLDACCSRGLGLLRFSIQTRSLGKGTLQPPGNSALTSSD